MNVIRHLCMLNALMMIPLGAVEVTRKQAIIYPQNPHLVQKAGDDQNDAERQAFIDGMNKASKGTRIASLVSGALTIGCLALVINSASTLARICSLGGSLIFGGIAFFAHKISAMQAAMAKSQELVETPTTPETAPVAKAAEVVDGIHIFSDTKICAPCKRLHAAMPKLKEALPDLAVFEYETDTAEAQALIQRLGINILSIPLTVVIKNGAIACIIPGYGMQPGSFDEFVQKITEALK